LKEEKPGKRISVPEMMRFLDRSSQTSLQKRGQPKFGVKKKEKGSSGRGN